MRRSGRKAEDGSAPRKQWNSAKRIFDRLRDEHGFEGGYTTVKDSLRERRIRGREVFMPLAHDPGHAQVDFRRHMDGFCSPVNTTRGESNLLK